MKKLLVPFDFSEQSVDAFRFALDIASQAQGPFTRTYLYGKNTDSRQNISCCETPQEQKAYWPDVFYG